jgi:hypothetical protein
MDETMGRRGRELMLLSVCMLGIKLPECSYWFGQIVRRQWQIWRSQVLTVLIGDVIMYDILACENSAVT